ncbi:DUF1642 domain-containing protein [Streptococcus pluranimalium]|uniref:DUF1642 domain-containing protein n=1 Tax=Streptococcus pluranimalium TaxID=82348 RepID=UPI004046EEB0
MNKLEAIEKIRDIDASKTYTKSELVSRILLIVEGIEPEKPVIPQFIADWIRYCKFTNINLLRAIKASDVDMYNYAYRKEANQIKNFLEVEENIELFAKAWLDGYEIEQEQLYTVEIPNPNCGGVMEKVKVFMSQYHRDIETEVNDFLVENKVKFIDIKYNSTIATDSYNTVIEQYSALLVYVEVNDDYEV